MKGRGRAEKNEAIPPPKGPNKKTRIPDIFKLRWY